MNANFVIDGKGLTADGTGDISDVPLSIRWTEDFAANDGVSTRVGLGGVVDDARGVSASASTSIG